MSVGSNKNVETLNRKTSTVSNNSKPNNTLDTEPDFELLNNGETGIDKRSASWLLTDEKRVQSIRSLLREDLWAGSYRKVKPSSSFRSEASDSGISRAGSNSSRKSVDSPGSTNVSPKNSFRNSASDDNKENHRNSLRKISPSNTNSTLQTTDTINENIAQRPPPRKISSSSTGLPGISEHVYSEITFLSRDQVTNDKQRRSVKKDTNNNNHPSPTLSRNSDSSLKSPSYDDVFFSRDNTDDNSSSSSHEVDNDFDYLENR